MIDKQYFENAADSLFYEKQNITPIKHSVIFMS